MNAPATIKQPQSVYAKIAAVQGELAKIGIGKDSNNAAQGYKFRGIDAVYNALAPLLARYELCILPRMVSLDRQERVTVKTYNGQSKESVTFYITVEAEFDFVSANDGSKHTIRTYGEAMDNGDKATNKAMSAAYKYAAFMTFAIPTEGDNDADATTHEVVAYQAGGQSQDGAVSPQPATAKRENWAGRYPNKSALHKALAGFERELAGCGDSDMVYGLTATPEWKDFVASCEDHAPHYLRGGEPAPPEFSGLLNTAERLVREFDGLTATTMANFATA